MQVKRKSNDNLKQAIKDINKKEVQVGWFESSTYENGMKVAQVAYMDEFGRLSNNQPPRPFFRNAIKDNKLRWSQTIQKISKDILNGSNVLTSLNLLGVVVESDVRKSITDLISPALSPVTIAIRKQKLAKGRSVASTIEKPLVDTGYMLATLTSEVK